jgi:hypothetical protein
MIKNITKQMLETADELEKQAKKMRCCVAKLQRENASEKEAEMFQFIDIINRSRQEAGLPPIVPLLTDSL